MTSRRRTYSEAAKELDRLRGDLVEEHPGRASPEYLEGWSNDPVGWDREAGREPTGYQAEVMESVARQKLTAWRGCHASGKEFTIASLAVWAAYARGMLVLVVSATEKQVIGQTMSEVRKAWRDARQAHGIGGELYRGAVRIGGEDRIIALTGSANVDALTGWHDAESGVLVAISEGQGERLQSVAYDAAFGNVTTGKGRILAAGNPVRPEGRFYEIHQREHWRQFRTSAFQTPNVKAGEMVRPGFPAPDWPEEIRREYGEDDPFYISRVEAAFPESAEHSLIEAPWIDDAFDRHRERDRDAELAVAAVDVARHGSDRSCVCIRRGSRVERFETWRGTGTMDTAKRAREEIEQAHDRGPVDRVIVDEVGVGGGVLDRLQETLELERQEVSGGIRRVSTRTATIRGFKAGERARDHEQYVNLGSQAYWKLRDMLEAGDLDLPPEEGLREELLALRREVMSDSRTRVDKSAAKARLGHSPDLADALVMTLLPKLAEAGKTEMLFGTG